MRIQAGSITTRVLQRAAGLLPLLALLAACSSAPEAETAPPREPGAPLVFTGQPGWVEEPPSSGMRKAQWRIGEASLVVFHFGGGGGTVEANFERWESQFEATSGEPEVARHTVGGMTVHELALSGTYVAETSPGSGERVNHPDWRLRAASVESDHGPYYVKLVGPEDEVRAQAAAFDRFLEAIR